MVAVDGKNFEVFFPHWPISAQFSLYYLVKTNPNQGGKIEKIGLETQARVFAKGAKK
jgi:hypothetical protein